MAASNTRFTQNSLGQSKNPIDSDHGIYRDHLVWAERRPELAHAVMAPLICWSLSSSMFRYLLVDHAVGDVPGPCCGEGGAD